MYHKFYFKSNEVELEKISDDSCLHFFNLYVYVTYIYTLKTEQN